MKPLVHPFRLLIAGRSHSGKTTLLMNLILKDQYYKGFFHEVYLYCPTYHSFQWSRVKLKKKNVFKTYTDDTLKRILITNIRRKKRILIIFSDCGAEGIKHPGHYRNVLDEAQMNARHYGASFIFEAQNLASLSTPTRHNADGIAVYETTNSGEIDELYRQYGSGNREGFRKVLETATTENYSFLFIHRQGPKQYYFVKFHSQISIK